MTEAPLTDAPRSTRRQFIPSCFMPKETAIAAAAVTAAYSLLSGGAALIRRKKTTPPDGQKESVT